MTENKDPVALLQTLRVLVVEDSFLVAASLKAMLSDMGCQVVGPAPNVREAQRLLDSQDVDAAILDVNLGNGETAEPIADRLAGDSVPFFFVTGYASPKLTNPRYKSFARLQKPLDRLALRETLLRHVDP